MFAANVASWRRRAVWREDGGGALPGLGGHGWTVREAVQQALAALRDSPAGSMTEVVFLVPDTSAATSAHTMLSHALGAGRATVTTPFDLTQFAEATVAYYRIRAGKGAEAATIAANVEAVWERVKDDLPEGAWQITQPQVLQVWRHLFDKQHDLPDGGFTVSMGGQEVFTETESTRYFDVLPDIAQAWQRLSDQDNAAPITPEDVGLLLHEWTEAREMEKDVPYRAAHATANKVYNWQQQVGFEPEPRERRTGVYGALSGQALQDVSLDQVPDSADQSGQAGPDERRVRHHRRAMVVGAYRAAHKPPPPQPPPPLPRPTRRCCPIWSPPVCGWARSPRTTRSCHGWSASRGGCGSVGSTASSPARPPRSHSPGRRRPGWLAPKAGFPGGLRCLDAADPAHRPRPAARTQKPATGPGVGAAAGIGAAVA